MTKKVRLTESDLNRIVKRLISEEVDDVKYTNYMVEINEHLDIIKDSFHALMDIKMEVMDDDSLSNEQIKEIEWMIESAFEDTYGTFLNDW
jgi:hypothetical protein